MKLRRYHGLGNDYLVLETPAALDPTLARAICDRHTGVGSDGILEPLPIRRDPESGRPVSHYALRIWNPDGSLAEKSGNGLRIFARWLRDQRAAADSFTVEVRLSDAPGEQVRCAVEGPRGAGSVTVQMGSARFDPAEVPCAAPLRDARVAVLGHSLSLTAVGVGNPHCVVFVDHPDELERLPWRSLGAALETHALFPNRTNVQFAAVMPASEGEPARVTARIWERGAGETLASGSSACAVAAAAVALGRVQGPVEVVMEGGALSVDVAANWQLTLRGPVEEVACIDLADGWMQRRRPTESAGPPD